MPIESPPLGAASLDARPSDSARVAEEPILDTALALGTPCDARALLAVIDVDLRGEAAGDGPFALNVSPGLPMLDSAALPTLHWTRLSEALVVIIAHAVALTALVIFGSPLPLASDTIDVSVIAAGDETPVTSPDVRATAPGTEAAPEPKQGQADTEQTPAPEASPPETPPLPAEAAQESVPTPAAEPPLPQPPAPQMETDQEPDSSAPSAVPERPSKPAEPPRPADQSERSQTAPPRPKPEIKPELSERPNLNLRKHIPPKSVSVSSEAGASKAGASEARHVGVAQGQATEIGRSRADYAALVVAQIEAHRFYPEAARTHSEQGVVGISFTIGAGGRVSSAAIIRSSGFAELDSTAREIVRSISPPPPPGGSFSASTTIRFQFE